MKDKSKITYYFTTGEKSEITVDMLIQKEGMTPQKAMECFKILQGFESQDKNLERKETRRHVSLYKFDDDVNPPKLRNEPLSLEEQSALDDDVKTLFDVIDTKLTDVQRRRLLLRLADQLTYQQIGDLDGVSHKQAKKSIDAAVEKINKYFS